MQAFLSNPLGYASGSQKAEDKINYLENTIRPKLTHAELVTYYEAKRQYEKALQENNSSDVICPRCNSRMIRRSGRFGEFWGCSRFPFCKGTRNIRWAR